jgi:hypothetical protein
MREAELIECFRALPGAEGSPRVAFSKGDEACFGGVEAQPVFSQSHRKDPEEAVGVVFALEERQSVIGVADDRAIAATVVGHDPSAPLIQDVIEKGIGDDRRHN